MKSKSSRFLVSLVFFLTLALLPARTFAQTNSTILPSVSVHAMDSIATETPGNNGTFRFTRYGGISNSLTVNFSISGLASNGVDYAAITDSITFAAGVSNLNLLIEPIDDTLVEGNEGVVLTLKTNSAYRIDGGISAGAVVTILDNDNLPPSVRLFNPTNNSSFTAPTNILLQAEASDSDGWIRRVEFYRGTFLIGTVLGHDSNTIYNLVWTNPPPGNYVLTARAIDNFEARSTSAPVNITIIGSTNTNPPPTVHIVEPTNNAMFFAPANINIYANATDNGFVATVEFFAGTNSLGITTNNPYSTSPVNPFHITWTNVSLGEYVLRAKATDNTGLMTTSGPVNISVKAGNVLPTVTIHATDPTAFEVPPFATVINYGVFTVSRNPAAPHPLVVRYAIGGTAANGVDYNSLSGSVTIASNAVSANIHVIPIDDLLIEGNETVVLTLEEPVCIAIFPPPPECYRLGSPATATVVIEDNDRSTNPPPTVRITSPTNNAVFIAPTNIFITAEASDTNGQVVRVDFFVGDKFLGSDSNAPYELLWTNVFPGSYNLSAKATDNGGAFQFSAPVHITVRSPNELAFVKRGLPMWYVPGVKFMVTLRAEPRFGTTIYSAEDHPPTNWTVGAISHGGSYDSAGNRVVFGPFNDGLARTLTYEITPPGGETGEKHFAGTAIANGVTTPIGGINFILPAPPHPADNNPTNFIIAENELTNYVAAWKQSEHWPISPNPIPINYVTRAGYIYGSGGGYHISTAFPTPFPPLLWVPGNLVLTAAADIGSNEMPWTTNGPGRAVSAMPTNYFPGVPFTVTITVTPSSNTLAYALEDRPPEGWAVTNISDGGVFSPVTRKIRWGLFQDNLTRAITYQVTPRTNLATATAIAYFAGVASFNGINVPITGQRITRYSSGTNSTPTLAGVIPLASGDRLMTFQGEAGICYIIEATTNFIDWTPLDGLLNNDGVLQYIDNSCENFEQRFYRVGPAP